MQKFQACHFLWIRVMKKKISDREGGGGGNDTFPKVFKALKKYSAYNSCPVIHAQCCQGLWEQKMQMFKKRVCIDKHYLLVVYLNSGEVYNI